MTRSVLEIGLVRLYLIPQMLHEKGFVQLHQVLSPLSVKQFVQQIETELTTGGQQAERCVGQLSLLDSTTWPKKGARRVVECAPLGVGSHWKELRNGLIPALDRILGQDQWELLFNTSDSDIRHFYCPITFPEHKYSHSSSTLSSASLSVSSSSPSSSLPSCASTSAATSTTIARPVLLESWKDEVAHAPFTNEDTDAPARWQPVSRRRFRGKGWHVDIGPGFSTEQKRTTVGHRFQGLIVLVLLSDWLPGGGGTAMVPGSHKWVYDMLVSQQNQNQDGIVHRDLNTLCVNRMLDDVKSQRLSIRCSEGNKNNNDDDNNNNNDNDDNNNDNSDNGNDSNIHLEQIVGNAGDVVLVHPLLIHSGTTNLRSTPRLLANGMVRLREGVRNHPLLQSLSTRLHERVDAPLSKKRKLNH